MDSNFLGWNEKGLSSNPSKSSSAKKSKKSGSDKPKQPQRGLGVAQLEKIRLQNQMGCTYLPSAHNPFLPNLSQVDVRLQSMYSSPFLTSNFSYTAAPYGFPATQGVMIGLSDADRANRYGDFQPANTPRWHQGTSGVQQVVEPNITRMFFETRPEVPLNQNQIVRDSSTQNTVDGGSKEIDLELRL